MDPETEFLASKRETGNEWELFKENVRPLKRGRNVDVLNHSLKSHINNQLKKSLLENRKRFIEAIDEYEGDDPLQPWLDCIKWVQEAFPPAGDFSGLVLIYEQCVRAFWHSDRYKDDLRYLKVWLEYAEHCSDAEVIYSFLDANDIGKTHSAYYIAHALHMESKSKMKAANDILTLGMSSNAQPIEKLRDAYKKFLARSMRSTKATEEELKDDDGSMRSFGTILARGENQRQTSKTFELGKNKLKPDQVHRTPFSVYNDNTDVMRGHHSKPITGSNSWHTLGGRAERNKENSAVPAKWTSHKIPQRPVPRTIGTVPSVHIEVFVDEECEEKPKVQDEKEKTSSLQLRELDGKNIKKETELLRENPLRNFPSNSLPRSTSEDGFGIRNSSPLTIFYNGTVSVFSVPRDKSVWMEHYQVITGIVDSDQDRIVGSYNWREEDDAITLEPVSIGKTRHGKTVTDLPFTRILSDKAQENPGLLLSFI